MPLYDYVCKYCLKVFEVQVPLSEDGKKIPCPRCEKKLKKIMSPVLFRMR